MEREVAHWRSLAVERAPAQETIPAWWAHARDFPRWYVWCGVAGDYYARIPGISPQVTVRAQSPDKLLDEIIRTELSRRPVPFQQEHNVHCA